METVQTLASDILVSLALGVISLLGAYGVYFIQKAAQKVRAQTEQIKGDQNRKLLDDALDDAEYLATVTVKSIEQMTAKSLREAVKDGTADREELVALGKQAFDEIKTAISPEAQRVITENLGSFDDYLSKLIESKVIEIKAATGQ